MTRLKIASPNGIGELHSPIKKNQPRQGFDTLTGPGRGFFKSAIKRKLPNYANYNSNLYPPKSLSSETRMYSALAFICDLAKLI